MLIKIKNIDLETVPGTGNKTSYQRAEVLYDSGQYTNQVKKLMSFTNPSVFKTISKAVKGDQFEVVVTKDDKGFNQWINIKVSDGAESAGGTSTSAPSNNNSSGNSLPVRTSTYETAEERAIRQRLIVRQSSLSNAITYGKDESTIEEILELAGRFADWVYEKPDLFDEPNDLETDIPF